MNEINHDLANEGLLDAAFERVQPDLMRLTPEQFLPVSLDITAAVTTVLGVLPEVRALRAELVAKLPTFDIARLDKLEDYALALGYAQSKYLAATQRPDDLDELSLEAATLRERLLAEVKTLTHHKLVSDEQLKNLKGANGKKNVATDVWVLAGLMQENWEKIQGRTFTTKEDLEHALRVATRVLRILGVREQSPAAVAEAAERRLRAYTQLLTTYEEAQLAIAYLRGTKYDADTIVPNLHPGRRGPRTKTEPKEETEGARPPVEPDVDATEGGAAPTSNTLSINGPFLPVS